MQLVTGGVERAQKFKWEHLRVMRNSKCCVSLGTFINLSEIASWTRNDRNLKEDGKKISADKCFVCSPGFPKAMRLGGVMRPGLANEGWVEMTYVTSG